MPLDVIMPALGMAQDTGIILTWHKSPGDPVAEGDALFDVETDKSAVEVAAQGSGYLTDVAAAAGDEVPVGKVLARISDTPEDSADTSASSADGRSGEISESDDESDTSLPEGEGIIMPALGMAQDAGLIVAWLKAPGDAVTAADVLFEVETDKSVVEVQAGHDGFVAALLAEQGEEAPVGDVIAIISREKPEAPVSRSLKARKVTAKAPPGPAKQEAKTQVKEPAPVSAGKSRSARPAPSADGRILASPKARRLALERGLDLSRLVEHGYPQPYHVKDLEVLETLPTASASATSAVAASRYLSAEVSTDGFEAFVAWAAKETGLNDSGAVLAGFAGASLGRKDVNVALEVLGKVRLYNVRGRRLGNLTAAEDEALPDVRLRDLRFGRLTSVNTGPEDIPVISVLAADAGLKLTLECAADQMDASTAINFLSDFAGRMEQPLRHLL